MSYTFQLSDLPKLDLQVDKGTDFTAWRLQWKSYCSLSGLVNEEASKQVEVLSLFFREKHYPLFQILALPTRRERTIIEALQSYVDSHLNETVERRNVCRCKQQPRESFDNFLISLRELAKTCRFCSEVCTEKNIRDQVIEGVYDSDTVEDLLQENNLTLARAISKCHSKEAAKKHRSDITAPELEVVTTLHHSHQPTYRTPPTCPRCGSATHRGVRRQCPTYNRTYAHCHKVGHFAKVCRSRQAQPLPSNNEH